MKRFDVCYPLVRKEEGGYSDRVNDRGGKTNFGVTQGRYDEFNDKCGFPRKPVVEIQEYEVKAIYMAAWLDAGCDRLPEGLDLLVFDVAINSGPAKSIVLLQRALAMEKCHHTGYFGPITAKWLEVSDIEGLKMKYLRERLKFYNNLVRSDPTQADNINGWLNRLEHMAAHVGMKETDYA